VQSGHTKFEKRSNLRNWNASALPKGLPHVSFAMEFNLFNKIGVAKSIPLALGAVALAIAAIAQPPTASALPSFARQTGQPCATCHTAFPELTPYGREFKLRGYTAGGTRCGDVDRFTEEGAAEEEMQIPIAGMTTPVFTHVQKGLPDNNNSVVQQTSVFLGGQIYCNLGAFIQGTYDRPSQSVFLDNADIRYTNSTKVSGIDVLLGLTSNNNPTVQDVWNSTPAWSFPYLSSEFAPSPGASTMIEGTFAGRVGSAGAYVWIDNMIYAEITAYGSFDPGILTTLGNDPGDGTPRFAGAAPYWRLAVEKTWDKNSFMVGTFGMLANIQPTVGGGSSALAFPVTDPFTDVGVDTEYQYIGDVHALTLRASYIWERQKLNGEFGAMASSNPTNELNSFKASASYIYDHTISVTGGYFNTSGTSDVLLYTGAGFTTGSPNSNGWTADLAYLPFSKGGPKIWPWLNGRIGITYTHYNKFDGSVNNVDQTPGRSAGNNDTTFIYTWWAF
jgi:hypothetical protein